MTYNTYNSYGRHETSYESYESYKSYELTTFQSNVLWCNPQNPQKTKTTQQPKGHCSMRPTIQKTNKTQKQQNKNKNLFQSDLYNQTIT